MRTTRTITCHHCGDDRPASEMTTGDQMRDEALAILGVHDWSTVCHSCADRAEREVDDAADALDAGGDPAFPEVCDARRDAWMLALDAELCAIAPVVRVSQGLASAVSL